MGKDGIRRWLRDAWLRRSTTTFTMRWMIGRRLRYQDLVKGNGLWSRAMAA